MPILATSSLGWYRTPGIYLSKYRNGRHHTEWIQCKIKSGTGPLKAEIEESKIPASCRPEIRQDAKNVDFPSFGPQRAGASLNFVLDQLSMMPAYPTND